jgi:uncharacterized protein YlzI (FlbEa/FlbD family)
MIKLTKLTFEMKETTQQRLDDIAEAFQEAMDYADTAGLPKPKQPKPVKMYNKDYNIDESPYYVLPNLIEEIWQDSEQTTILTIAGRDATVKETVEEVYKLIQEYGSSK